MNMKLSNVVLSAAAGWIFSAQWLNPYTIFGNLAQLPNLGRFASIAGQYLVSDSLE
jgi:hypothetical protein